MSGLGHFRAFRHEHFHLHPLLGTFSLISSFLLAVLLMLLLVPSAK